MIRRTRVLATIAALGLLCVWLVAQVASSSQESLARFFPGGAILYVEARDLTKLVRDWDSSPEKKLWVASDNYQVFSRSRLFLKLGEAQTEFAEAAGLLPDMSLVRALAGAESALAIYDIGALEFVYIGRVDSARVLETALWQSRGSFDTREVAGRQYYLRRSSAGRTAAFATSGDMVVLATSERLMPAALQLIGGASASSLPQERWFTDAQSSARSSGAIRLVLNMRELLKSPYFRSYWVQRNATELRAFTSGVIDITLADTQIAEQRTFLRDAAIEKKSDAETAVAQASAWAPDDVNLSRVWADPPVTQVLQLLQTKLTNPGAQTDAESKTAPATLSPDAIAGTADDLDTRIDQPPLPGERGPDLLAAVRDSIGRNEVRAMLHLQSSRPGTDGIFVGTDTAIALLGSGNWPDVKVGNFPVARRGRALVVSDSTAMLAKVNARLSARPSPIAGSYYSRYLHSRELPVYSSMMEMIDSAQSSFESQLATDREPPFFSRNVASLGRTLGRLRMMSVSVRHEDRRTFEDIVYQLQ